MWSLGLVSILLFLPIYLMLFQLKTIVLMSLHLQATFDILGKTNVISSGPSDRLSIKWMWFVMNILHETNTNRHRLKYPKPVLPMLKMKHPWRMWARRVKIGTDWHRFKLFLVFWDWELNVFEKDKICWMTEEKNVSLRSVFTMRLHARRGAFLMIVLIYSNLVLI